MPECASVRVCVCACTRALRACVSVNERLVKGVCVCAHTRALGACVCVNKRLEKCVCVCACVCLGWVRGQGPAWRQWGGCYVPV